MSKSKKFGIALMILGMLCVSAALLLFFSNQQEDQQAGNSVDLVLPQLIEHIAEEETEPPVEETEAVYASEEMTEVIIDGYAYIGYVSIPTLDLYLPVMSQWDYPSLKIAPCRYTGSTKTDDLTICAHNYARHFGGIKNLSAGDEADFTDMDGVVIRYQVVSVEILEPTAVEDMTDSGYDLTLFTCTYGGASRVTVRCERIS